jgi:hypothetical protein
MVVRLWPEMAPSYICDDILPHPPLPLLFFTHLPTFFPPCPLLLLLSLLLSSFPFSPYPPPSLPLSFPSSPSSWDPATAFIPWYLELMTRDMKLRRHLAHIISWSIKVGG